MRPGGISVIGDMPYYVYAAPDGAQVALPCTERLYSERQASQAVSYHVMPVVSLKGRPEVRLAGVSSVAGTPLAGFWGPVSLSGAPPPPVVEEVPETTAAAPDEVPEEAADAASVEAAADEAAPEPSAEADDLDALLASLSAPADAPAEGEAEADLAALLASL